MSTAYATRMRKDVLFHVLIVVWLKKVCPGVFRVWETHKHRNSSHILQRPVREAHNAQYRRTCSCSSAEQSVFPSLGLVSQLCYSITGSHLVKVKTNFLPLLLSCTVAQPHSPLTAGTQQYTDTQKHRQLKHESINASRWTLRPHSIYNVGMATKRNVHREASVWLVWSLYRRDIINITFWLY